MWLHFSLSHFSLQFKLLTVREWTCPSSESPTLVPTVLRDQATGSAMPNAPALQEEAAGGGHEQHTFAVRVILPKQEVKIRISVYMGRNEPNQIRSFHLMCL